MRLKGRERDIQLLLLSPFRQERRYFNIDSRCARYFGQRELSFKPAFRLPVQKQAVIVDLQVRGAGMRRYGLIVCGNFSG